LSAFTINILVNTNVGAVSSQLVGIQALMIRFIGTGRLGYLGLMSRGGDSC